MKIHLMDAKKYSFSYFKLEVDSVKPCLRNLRYVLICSIILIALIGLIWMAINITKSKFYYKDDLIDVKFIIHANESIPDKIKQMIVRGERKFYRINKISIVKNNTIYNFDIHGRSVYTASDNFRFEKVDIDIDFINYIGIHLPQDSEHGQLFMMKHNSSAEFPTFYFYIDNKFDSKYSQLKISWP